MTFSKILKFFGMENLFISSRMSGKLLHASKVGDPIGAKSILTLFPKLVRFKYFKGKNTPLHIAAARGYVEIVELLLRHGGDVNVRNGAGQTALMIACRLGRIPIVQILLLFKAQIEISDDINCCTALHYAAGSGHVECLRLCLADYVPDVFMLDHKENKTRGSSTSWQDCPSSTLHEVLNLRADGGITALHLASFYGKYDCVHLLLDLGAWIDAISLHVASFECDIIGNNSSALHFAAFNGSFSCCQILLAFGADRTQKNANGWTPCDVARIRGHRLLEELLVETSMNLPLPATSFPPSRFLAYPLRSIIRIAREIGLEDKELGDNSYNNNNLDNICGICLEKFCVVESEGCKHTLCCHCALQLCCTGQSYSATSFSSITVPPSTSSSSNAMSVSNSLSSVSSTASTSSFRSISPSNESQLVSSHSTSDISLSSTSALPISSLRSLAGMIPCPFCRTPITKFQVIIDLNCSEITSTEYVMNEENMIHYDGANHNEEGEGEGDGFDFSFNSVEPVDWCALKLPNGCLLKEAEELEEEKKENEEASAENTENTENGENAGLRNVDSFFLK